MPFLTKERTLFRLFGLPIKANLSWLFLVALVWVSLALGYFPGEYGFGPGRPWFIYWLYGLVGATGLFASLIAHEMCHSLVARATGMPVAGITLFIFGGVSQLRDEPPTAGAEFLMAVVGPLSSVLIGTIFGVLWFLARSRGWGDGPRALILYLFIVNFALAGFNSLPAFPLDGGRVVRSVLWGITDDLRFATHVAATVGSFFGFGLIALGLIGLFYGAGFAALWAVVLGFFLRQAARGSLQMVVLRQHLEGERVSDFMTTNVVTVPRDLDVQEFVDRYVFHHRFTCYPVVDREGNVLGIVSARAPRELESEDWSRTTVGELMQELDETMTLDPDVDAVDALSLLRQREESRGIVVEDGKPVGILSLRDLLQFLALKIDLEPRTRL
ncbi:MAG: site-2 protease family protein [Candidatus Brocadiaceae bacterium]|jgi:Zn-dependent protease/CBS domain-containing protein